MRHSPGGGGHSQESFFLTVLTAPYEILASGIAEKDFLLVLAGIALAVSCILIVWLIGSLIFEIADSSYVPRHELRSVVLRKRFVPKSSHASFMMIGLMPLPRISTDPATWLLTIMDHKGKEAEVSVSEELYGQVSEGTPLRVSYGLGRFSGRFYEKNLCTA